MSFLLVVVLLITLNPHDVVGNLIRSPNLFENPEPSPENVKTICFPGDECDPWVIEDGVLQIHRGGTCDSVPPRSPNLYFYAVGICGHGRSFSRANQQPNLGGYAQSLERGDARAIFSGYIRSYGDGDYGTLLLSSKIGQASWVDLGSAFENEKAWILVVVDEMLAPKVTNLKTTLIGNRRGGTDLDAYFSDLSLILETTCCSRGQFWKSRGVCETCPIGFYSTTTGSPSCAWSCLQCPLGTTSSNGIDCTECPVGWSNSKYSNNGYATLGYDCYKCPAGYITTSEGNAACEACPAGTYQSTSGQTFCLPCDDGRYSTAGSPVCKTCATNISNVDHWSGGGLLSDCVCIPGWSGSDCELDKCSDVLRISLGSLYLMANRLLRSYSELFYEIDRAIARAHLFDLITITLDVDGDQVITRDEFLIALADGSVDSLHMRTADFPAWCRNVLDVKSPCSYESIPTEEIFNDAYNNYLNSPSHTFDGSASSFVTSMSATFPSTSWTSAMCRARQDQNAVVQWNFTKLTQPASIRRVCGYTNGVMNSDFEDDSNLQLGITSTFIDTLPVDADNGPKRVYCISVETCQGGPCTIATSDYSIACTVGLRYVSSYSVSPFFSFFGVL
jgi:hypothetical protein